MLKLIPNFVNVTLFNISKLHLSRDSSIAIGSFNFTESKELVCDLYSENKFCNKHQYLIGFYVKYIYCEASFHILFFHEQHVDPLIGESSYHSDLSILLLTRYLFDLVSKNVITFITIEFT